MQKKEKKIVIVNILSYIFLAFFIYIIYYFGQFLLLNS